LFLGLFVVSGSPPGIDVEQKVAAMHQKLVPSRQLKFGSAIIAIALSRDSAVIAVGLADGQMVFVRYEDWQEFGRVNTGSEPLSSISFSPDGRHVATASDQPVIKIWNVTDGKPWKEISSDGGLEVRFVGYAPNGKTICAAGDDGVVRLYSTENWQVVSEFREVNAKSIKPISVPRISALAFRPDGQRIAVGFRDGTVVLSAVDLSEVTGFSTTERAAVDLVFGADAQLAAAADGVRIWQLAGEGGDQHLTRDSLGHFPGSVGSISFSSDGKSLAIGIAGGPNQPSHVVVCSVNDKAVIAEFACHQKTLKYVRFVPTTDRLLTVSFDGTLCEWDVLRSKK
jgi:WD40 repeat protein